MMLLKIYNTTRQLLQVYLTLFIIMNSTKIVAVLLLVCIVGAKCGLIPEEQLARVHNRVKRFTCDVMSAQLFSMTFNHSICAIHCILFLNGGGGCNPQGVCICR